MTEPERRMTHAEAVLLTRYAKAACPQQQFDQYTPDAWSDLLGDLRFEDCQAGLKAVVQSQPFVSPAEIRAAVKRLRVRRLEEYGPTPDPPFGMSANPEAYTEWNRRMMRAVMDGDLKKGDPIPEAPELVARPMPDLERVLPRVPHARPEKTARPDADKRREEARAQLAAMKPAPIPEQDA